MKTPDWKATAELLGIFAILVSLVFVALQLRNEEELIRLEMRNSMIANSAAVREFIAENADIWVRGNADEELDAVELEIYRQLLINFNDWHFQTSQIFREIDEDAEDQILSVYAGFLARNPGAYEVWIERERELNADRRSIDPAETVTSDWIATIESRIDEVRCQSDLSCYQTWDE